MIKTWYQDLNFLDSGIKLTADSLPLESSYYRFQNRLELENLNQYVIEKIKRGEYQEFIDAHIEHNVLPTKLSNGVDISLSEILDKIGTELNKGDNSRIIFAAPKKSGEADGLYENKLQMVATGNQLNEQVNTLTDSELHTMIQVAKNYWLEAGASSQLLDKINFSIAELDQNSGVDTRAIAVTKGLDVIIDSTAKGYGWYVDATASTNEEYQVDNTGYRYTALTEAKSANSIDLLTVLIHEMGNVLGVSHRQDNDVMTLRINLGERRLPSLEDAQYLAWLNTGVLNSTNHAITPNDIPQHTCFAAGVLVHTDKGLVPIEQLKVGDMVLSAPEDATPSADGKLETNYKPITQVFESDEKQKIMAPLGNPSVLCTINHPFWSIEKGWVRADEIDNYTSLYLLLPPLWSKEKGWVRADKIDTYTSLYQLLPPPSYDHYYQNQFWIGGKLGEEQMYLLETPFENIAVGFNDNDTFGWSDRWNNMPYIKDFNSNKYVISPYCGNFNEELTEQERVIYQEALEYIIYEHNYNPYKATVYNIEVADTHTYFVGELGIWVHNCDPSTINEKSATLNNSEQWQLQGEVNTDVTINSVTLVESSP